MAVPKIFSFGSWDSDHPKDRHPGERIDAQFDAHANAIGALEARIDAIVRADGKLHADVIPIVSPRQIVAPRSEFFHPGSTNVATLSEAAAENWAEVSMEWAEHMPDTIPGNILATNAVTGDHWSARWWANQAALIVGGGAGVASFNGRVGIVTLTNADIAAAGAITTVSPTFTGDPKAPTPLPGDNDTSIATTAFVAGAVAGALVGLAPTASPVFTGDPKAPTPATVDNDTSIATTAFVKAQGYATSAAVATAYAPLASPVFTGNPTAPTPTAGDSDTSIATTAFVQAAKGIGSVVLGPTRVFTASGTFTPTAGMAFCVIECVGGGGGGGGTGNAAAGSRVGGGGGAGGSYSRIVLPAGTAGLSGAAVTVGAAGAGVSGNINGGAGGPSSVGALCTAPGGGGGGGAAGTGGGGVRGISGGAGTGDFSVPGGDGQSGKYASILTVNLLEGGEGGIAGLGFGTGGRTASAGAGQAGKNYGGGGGGGGSANTSGAGAGTDGAQGIVIITEFVK